MLDSRAPQEVVDLNWLETWDAFVAESSDCGRSLGDALGERLEQTATELDRLAQGPLADALRVVIDELTVEGIDAPEGVEAVNLAAMREVLGRAKDAASVFKGAKFVTKGGRSVSVGPILEVLGEGADLALDFAEQKKIDSAKARVAELYASQAGEYIESWRQAVDEIRDDTTQSALGSSAEVKKELLDQLRKVGDEVRSLTEAQGQLDDFVSRAIASGYEIDVSAGDG